MKYLILESSDRLQLIEKVNSKLQNGWELTGGVSIVRRGPGDYIYSQAIFYRG